MAMKQYLYRVTFINDDGQTITHAVEARNTFEAVQLAGAFGKVIISVINCDL